MRTILCSYRYDPLDQLIGRYPLSGTATDHFYCHKRLTTEFQGTARRSFLQHGDQLLAHRESLGSAVTTSLLATDQQRSILHGLNAASSQAFAFTIYGYRPLYGLLSLLAFNGERPDPVTGNYLLGNGYRQFSPVLMRFLSPDSRSPFKDGGLNPYAYCEGDPRNYQDPTGHRRLYFIDPILTRLEKSGQLDPKLNFRQKVQVLAARIKKNEAQNEGQQIYTKSVPINDLSLSAAEWEMAKIEYDFQMNPRLDTPYVWTNPRNGHSLLETAHFDIDIFHLKNVARSKGTGRDLLSISKARIRRAEYLFIHTGIDYFKEIPANASSVRQ